MNAARILRHSRLGAGLTQRSLAARAGVPQPSIAKIERGVTLPRVDTLNRLLQACGVELEPERRLGVGVDRTGIRHILALSPAERLWLAMDDAQGLTELLGEP